MPLIEPDKINVRMTALINYISQIIDLEESEKKLIRTLFRKKKYRKGAYFLKEGKTCDEIGFITKGLVAYCIEGDETHVYDFGKENEFISNYESLLAQSASSKSIICIEDTEILYITYSDLQTLYDRVSEGQKLGRLISEKLFLEAIKKLTSFYTDSPENRYWQFSKNHPGLIQRIPQYYIASYINVKPQSLSRIRKRSLIKAKVNPGE